MRSVQKQDNRAVHDVEHGYKIEQHTEEDGQIDYVNIKFLNHYHKSPGILSKLEPSPKYGKQYHLKETQAVIEILYHIINIKFCSQDQQKM